MYIENNNKKKHIYIFVYVCTYKTNPMADKEVVGGIELSLNYYSMITALSLDHLITIWSLLNYDRIIIESSLIYHWIINEWWLSDHRVFIERYWILTAFAVDYHRIIIESLRNNRWVIIELSWMHHRIPIEWSSNYHSISVAWSLTYHSTDDLS